MINYTWKAHQIKYITYNNIYLIRRLKLNPDMMHNMMHNINKHFQYPYITNAKCHHTHNKHIDKR